MYDLGVSLRPAEEDARGRLQAAERAVARAGAGGQSGRGADAAMAATARAAIFTEALVAAEHARFAELKAVAR